MFQSQELMHNKSPNFNLAIEYDQMAYNLYLKNHNYTLKIPREFINSSIQSVYIREGMSLNMFDVTTTHATSIDIEIGCTPLSFGVIISGSFEMQYNKNKGKYAVHNSTPQEIVGRHNNISGKLNMPAHDRFQVVGVSISDALIEEMLYAHEEYEGLQKHLQDRKRALQVIGAWNISPAMHCIASQVLNCSLQGKNKALYLESKALEIMALQLEKLQSHPLPSISIKRGDIEKLHEARNLLFESIEEPLNLHELAAKVGINDFRLKQGFKKLFNNTVYGSLRKHRMEVAKMRLLEGDTTVTEVASSIGYTNISHFIAAFRKQYTINPGELLRKNSTISHKTYNEKCF